MIQLNPTELNKLTIDLKLFSAFCLNLDNRLTKVIKEMQPQFHNDNFGTDGNLKQAQMAHIINSMDALDKLKNYTDGFINGIEAIQKGSK
jgi:hypothetical protein